MTAAKTVGAVGLGAALVVAMAAPAAKAAPQGATVERIRSRRNRSQGCRSRRDFLPPHRRSRHRAPGCTYWSTGGDRNRRSRSRTGTRLTDFLAARPRISDSTHARTRPSSARSQYNQFQRSTLRRGFLDRHHHIPRRRQTRTCRKATLVVEGALVVVAVVVGEPPVVVTARGRSRNSRCQTYTWQSDCHYVHHRTRRRWRPGMCWSIGGPRSLRSRCP